MKAAREAQNGLQKQLSEDHAKMEKALKEEQEREQELQRQKSAAENGMQKEHKEKEEPKKYYKPEHKEEEEEKPEPKPEPKADEDKYSALAPHNPRESPFPAARSCSKESARPAWSVTTRVRFACPISLQSKVGDCRMRLLRMAQLSVDPASRSAVVTVASPKGLRTALTLRQRALGGVISATLMR